MALDIEKEPTCQLARELAGLTSETMTGAITIALRERLEREKRVQVNRSSLYGELSVTAQRGQD